MYGPTCEDCLDDNCLDCPVYQSYLREKMWRESFITSPFPLPKETPDENE